MTDSNKISMAGRFRKKPVVIDAYQFHNRVCTTDNRPAWLLEAVDRGEVAFTQPRDSGAFLIIKTLEGEMRADVDDWVIRGVKGEIYPCKPDIFEATYDPA